MTFPPRVVADALHGHAHAFTTAGVVSTKDAYVIRSKEAAGRDNDLAQLPLLRRTLEQIGERELRPPKLER